MTPKIKTTKKKKKKKKEGRKEKKIEHLISLVVIKWWEMSHIFPRLHSSFLLIVSVVC